MLIRNHTVLLNGLIWFSFLLFSVQTHAQKDTTWHELDGITSKKEQTKRILETGRQLRLTDPKRFPDFVRYVEGLYAEKPFNQLRALVMSFQAMELSDQGSLLKSIKLHERTLDILRLMRPSKQLAVEYNLIGIVYHQLGKIDLFISYTDSAISVVNAIQDYEYKNTLVNNRVYVLKDFDPSAALSILKELDKELAEMNKPSLRATTNLNISHLYREEFNNLDSAIHHANKSYDLRQIAREQIGTASALILLGELYIDKGEYDIATAYLDQGKSIADSLNLKHKRLRIDLDISKIYIKTNRPEKAVDLLQTAQTEIVKYNFNDLHLDLYPLLTEALSNDGLHKEALEVSRNYFLLNDSLNGLEMKNHLAQLEARYRVNEKEHELEILKKKMSYPNREEVI